MRRVDGPPHNTTLIPFPSIGHTLVYTYDPVHIDVSRDMVQHTDTYTRHSIDGTVRT